MPRTPRYVSRLTRDTLAIILAGGRGTRLQQLTIQRAKPATPFGGKFRIIDFTLSNCVNSGIRKIGVATQYKAHQLIQHIGRGWNFMRGEFGEFVEVLPAQQRIDASWYQGTADAVYQNIDIIRTRSPKHILVLAGDHVYKMDYGPMIASHVERGSAITVGCIEVSREAASAFGVMSVDESLNITKFSEKPADPEPMPGSKDICLASMGIYVFDAEFLYEELTRDAANNESNHDFGKDIIPNNLPRGGIIAYPFRDVKTRAQHYWRDVGTVDAYFDANMELIQVQPELNLYDESWPIWTYQRQLPPAKFVLNHDGRRGTAINSMVSGGCIVSGAHVEQSLLFSQVRVDEGSELTRAVVLPDVQIGKNCIISKAVIDENCVIEDGTEIGQDAEADARRFHVTPAGVALVTPDMLGQRERLRDHMQARV